MLIVANGGWGWLSDQFVTIPLFNESAFYQETVIPVKKNGAVTAYFIQHNTGYKFFFFNHSLTVDQQKPVFRRFRVDQHSDSEFG